MKHPNNYKLFFACIIVLCSFSAIAQEEKPKPKLLLEIGYHLSNNKIPFVSVYTKSKNERKFLPVPNISVKIYLTQEGDANLLGTVKTNNEGRAIVSFPPSVQALWDTATLFTIVGTTDASKDYRSISSETSATKAKINIDTVLVDGARNILVTVTKKQGKDWVPAKDIETKITVKRSIGNLSVSDAETYTTDSAGQATVEFKRIGIPGDEKGNITLVARTEDNEFVGNLSIEKTVPWGSNFVNQGIDFNRRTLFATRDKAPWWLLFLAGSIFIGVWSVIIYLVRQIIKMRNLGNT